MPDPTIDKSYLGRTQNATPRAVRATPQNGILRFIGLHEAEDPAYAQGAAGVLDYGLTHGPVVGQRGSGNWYIDYPTGRIYHYVLEETTVAWHAGASAFRDVRGVDPALQVARLSVVSIGIEMDLPGDGTPPSPAQWTNLLWLLRRLGAYWHIPLDAAHLWEHRSVALPPGRKHDPEGYRLQDVLRRLLIAG